MITITELYKTIQGESLSVGLPSVMIRLAGCNLRCNYCDTQYSHQGGKEVSVDELIDQVERYKCKLITITGGEPLLQEEVFLLSERLIKNKYQVLIETNGSINVGRLHQDVIRIIDIKCPDSGMSHAFCWKNLECLRRSDEIKFVISSKNDYQWSLSLVQEYSLTERCSVIFSPVQGSIDPTKLAEWIIHENIPVRFQLQLHKILGIR